MREVGVHGDDMGKLAGEYVPKSRAVRTTKTTFIGAVDDVHVAKFASQVVGGITRAVWAVVVDDQNMNMWCTCAHRTNKSVDIFNLVIGG